MSRRQSHRQFALAGVALLAAAISLAVTAKTRTADAPLPARQASYTALAGAAAARPTGQKTACGVVVKAATEGITNPVLPCGLRLYIGYHGTEALVAVIGHGPSASGPEFGLTPRLAARLGLHGVQRIRWSYAAGG